MPLEIVITYTKWLYLWSLLCCRLQLRYKTNHQWPTVSTSRSQASEDEIKANMGTEAGPVVVSNCMVQFLTIKSDREIWHCMVETNNYDKIGSGKTHCWRSSSSGAHCHASSELYWFGCFTTEFWCHHGRPILSESFDPFRHRSCVTFRASENGGQVTRGSSCCSVRVRILAWGSAACIDRWIDNTEGDLFVFVFVAS